MHAVQNANNCSSVSLHMCTLKVHAQCAQGMCSGISSFHTCMHSLHVNIISEMKYAYKEKGGGQRLSFVDILGTAYLSYMHMYQERIQDFRKGVLKLINYS